MQLRETGLVAIYNRIKARRGELALNKFMRSPTTTLNDVPFLIMLEGVDEIIKRTERHPLGYPCVRDLEVILELTVNEKSSDIRALLQILRDIVFNDGIEVAPNTFIQEVRMEGPFGYGVPDILGMRLILGMTYPDSGI